MQMCIQLFFIKRFIFITCVALAQRGGMFFRLRECHHLFSHTLKEET